MLTAEVLLNRFAVYGRFYEKEIGGVTEQMRDRLEIAPRGMPLQDVLEREPDLLVVMMNPGASRALDALWDDGGTLGFVAAVPDRTQYQIMRLLMAANDAGRDWEHARILNLSDLRTPKSAFFIEKLQTYAADDSHSLFSRSRTKECEALFSGKQTPVLLGWGLNAQFGELADRALEAAKGHPLLGLSADGRFYRHPLPQRYDLQVTWLAQLEGQIKELKP
jgi:hypothetical protein